MNQNQNNAVLNIVQGIGNIIGKVFRFICKFTFVSILLCFFIGIVLGSYVLINVWPIVSEYREIAYDKFGEIGPNTFSYLGDTVIYDNNGEVIGQINVGNYKYVEIEDVSKWIQEGYIAVEDKRFKVHHGIDYKALARAAVSIVTHGGKVTQGGSTITQQVLKNNLLTQERTLKRKIVEFFLAPEFEDRYSKQDIMEFYINTCFYGNNCYGIETASQYYFGKACKDLDIAEASMLVGISNNGSLYNPKRNMEGCVKRQNIVLSEMLEENVITEEEYKKAKEEKLNFVYQREPRQPENYMTSYTIACATKHIMEEQGFEFKYIFDTKEEYDAYKKSYSYYYEMISSKIREGGYKIYTSFDVEIQSELQEILDKCTAKYTEVAEDGRYTFQSAAVLVNNETGMIEAMIGGRGTEDEYNRGFLARRQPGSSIKPLAVYTPAFNTGLYYPSLIMSDEPNEDDKYYPVNYDGSYRGNVTIKEAVGRSLNTIAYQVMDDLSPKKGLEYLGKMRFDSITYDDYLNTSIALGGFTYGVRVVDMAKGYATLVNQGEYINSDCVYKIEYQNEGVIFEEDFDVIEVYEPDAAYMMVDCCEGVINDYYPYRKVKNAVTMAKSGTTNDSKDTWFCGSSVYYSLAVWSGYDMPKDTGLTGSKLSAEIWQKMMTTLHENTQKEDFERPDSVIDLPIDYQGKIANYNTEVYGIFSQTLLDRAEEERKAQEERKKIEKDNKFIESIWGKLDTLNNYIVTDENALTYLQTKFKEIEKDIGQVYQNIPKQQLSQEYRRLKDYFELDMRELRERKNRQNVINAAQEEVNYINGIVQDLNNFDIMIVDSIDSIEKVENEYNRIFEKTQNLSKEQDIFYYQGLLNEIKGYKEILLKPYREEKIRLEEEEKQTLYSEIIQKTDELFSLSDYDIYVEELCVEIDSLFERAIELNMDVTDLYNQYQEYKQSLEEIPIIPFPEDTFYDYIDEEIEDSENKQEE